MNDTDNQTTQSTPSDQPETASTETSAEPQDNATPAALPQPSALQVGGAIPTGASIGAPVPQLAVGAPIPQGATIGPPAAKSNPLQINDTDNPLVKEAKGVGQIFSGVGEGLFSTAAGAADIVHAPEQARQLLHTLAGDNTGEQRTGLEQVGYGGETLAEFLMGDSALKALPMAKRLEVAAKAMKVVEGSPRLAQALQVGTKILKLATLHGAEAGLVQGAQTAVRTPGTLEERAAQGAKEGAETATLAGGLGSVTGAVGEAAQKAGEVAGKVKNLSTVAEGAKSKEEIAQELSNRIKGAKAQMHGDFEAGINDIKDRLQGQEISAQENPLATKAKALLAKPNPEENPLVVTAKNAAGDKLDKPVKEILEQASTGTIPVEDETAPEAKPTILDASGKPIKSETNLVPKTKPIPDYNIDDLVKFRQAIRTLSDGYELGDINARVLRKVNDAVDDTIGKLAQKSGDPTALQDYQNLRAQYRDKVHVFDDPIIEKLHDGKYDDAAKAFVGVQRAGSALPSAGGVTYNTNNLRTIIGDDGIKAFGKDVFKSMLKDSTDANGHINPAKFSQTWGRINDQTKGDLFDANNAQSGLNQLAKDSHAAAQLQHLSRLGVLGTAGTIAGGNLHLLGMGVGTAAGLIAAEGGGIPAARDFLDAIVNHPAIWRAYEKAGEIAAKGTGKIPSAVASTITNAANQKGNGSNSVSLGSSAGNWGTPPLSSIKNTYQDLQSQLSKQ
jgi:hypothetical protein